MNKKLVGNAADPRQVRKADRVQVSADERQRADLTSVLDSVQGRRVLWNLFEFTGVLQLSYAVGADAATTAYFEGRRSVGLAILSRINEIDPMAYGLMAKEARILDDALTTSPTNKENDDGNSDDDSASGDS